MLCQSERSCGACKRYITHQFLEDTHNTERQLVQILHYPAFSHRLRVFAFTWVHSVVSSLLHVYGCFNLYNKRHVKNVFIPFKGKRAAS